MDKDISTLLNEIKAATGWNQNDLAKKLCVTQPTINRILRGQKECKGSTARAILALHDSIFSRRKPSKKPKTPEA